MENELENFPFDKQMLSCVNKGKFPDLAIKLNDDDEQFAGGELIELKDSKTYSVASFNSTIPTGEKDIKKLTEGQENTIRTQMEEAGDAILSLPIRQVFYLIRGKKQSNVKVCLTHGKFFETVPVSTLISESFGQALEERLDELGESLSPSLKHKLLDLFSEQQTFSRTRNVDDASVRLRFRIMTEVKAGANILNPNQYPQIGDNTLNFAVPCHGETEQNQQHNKMRYAFEEMRYAHLFSQVEVFSLQHHFNGKFLIFQTNLS
ncbi:hypothetical protein F4054_04175 [Candidatus Poribacteria bacterium]|nr:hypothetical protein [Candidatus Poribacteria bacterium]MYK21440.1 hypothetical protein [Candidatus Poribacteria bacterium]